MGVTNAAGGVESVVANLWVTPLAVAPVVVQPESQAVGAGGDGDVQRGGDGHGAELPVAV